VRGLLGAGSAALLAAVAAWPAAGADLLAGLGEPAALLGEAASLGLPVAITADSLSYDEATGVAVAEGNVEVTFGSRKVRAGAIRYDVRRQEAEFTADVHYQDADDDFRFERIRLNLAEETGLLTNGRIRLGTKNYLIAGRRIEKTGKRSFLLEGGTITTCPCCDPPPDWSFEVGRCRVEVDGYATARDVTLRVRGVPVAWLPYAVFPVKLSRQTGFLLPDVLNSPSRGLTVSLPFYWAASRWSDATLTLEAMSRRGLRPEGEFRYVLNPRSEGVVRGTVYRDRVLGATRSRLYGSNVFLSPSGFTVNAAYDAASDERFYVDLVDADILRTARHVPSRAFAAKAGEGSEQALSVTLVQDTQGAPTDRLAQRLPEYTGTWLPRELGRSGLFVSGQAQAARFERRAGDASQGRAYLELARPLFPYPSVVAAPFLFVDVLASREEAAPDGSMRGYRAVPGGGLLLGADLRRDFGAKERQALAHLVSLRAGARFVPSVDQRDIAVVDQWSRIGRRREWTASVEQRLLRLGPEPAPAELASLSVEWSMDAAGTRADSPYVDPLSPYPRALRDQVDLGVGAERTGESPSDVFARFRAAPWPGWLFSGESLYDARGGRLVASSVGGEWSGKREAKARAGYRLTRGLAEDVEIALSGRPVRLVGLEAAARYSVRNDELTEGSAGLTLYPRSNCWKVGLAVVRRARPAETSVRLTFGLAGIGSIGE